MTRAQRQARRREVLREAAAVYQGEDEPAIRQRLATFRTTWAEREPQAVATLERDFDQTLAYLHVLQWAHAQGQTWRVEDLRTTSRLERVQRHFRQKARQVVIFHAAQGVTAAIELVLHHRHLTGTPHQAWSAALEDALLAA